MKILHIIPDFLTKTGGPVAALKTMTSSQAEFGHEVSIATTHLEHDKSLKIKNVNILYFNCDIRAIRYSLSLKKYLKDNIIKFDIVHIHTIWQYPTFIAGKICKKYNVPYILRPCGMLDKWSFKQKKVKKTVYYKLFEMKTIKNASMIHCTSRLEEKESDKHLINSTIFILPLSINILPKLKEKNISKPYILYLSRLHYNKQPDLLIKSFSKIINDYPKYQLVFAGSCENTYMRKLLNLIRLHKLENKVIFKGMVIGKSKENLLANADIFVLPSHHENFGIAVAEAMGAGLPVIVGEKVALGNDVIKYNTGLVIKPDLDNIVKAIKILLSSSVKRKVMGNNGYEYVKNYLSKEKITKQLMTKYEEIIINFKKNKI